LAGAGPVKSVTGPHEPLAKRTIRAGRPRPNPRRTSHLAGNNDHSFGSLRGSLMHSITRRLQLIGSALLLATVATAAFANGTDYNDGPVVVRSAIRTTDGHFDDYMHWLDTVWKRQEEAAKKAGILTDYKVLVAQPRGPQDPDIYLVEVYPNWATFDGLGTKMDGISKQIWGSLKQAGVSEAGRDKIRTILGSEVMQEADLK
jgi:hypothetical protein